MYLLLSNFHYSVTHDFYTTHKSDDTFKAFPFQAMKPTQKMEGFGERPQVSNEKRDPGCLGCIRDYTTQLQWGI